MQKICLLIAAICWTLTACGQRPAGENNAVAKEITVSAAASLQEAFREIGAIYERQNNVKINFNFASSGALQKQIEGGAPVDVFASAGKPQIDALASQNLILPETRRDFVQNELVLIVPAKSDVKPTSFVQILENEKARLAIGNPKTVPVGQYAEQTLVRLGVWEKLQGRLILAEDVRQVLEYVSRGEVEAGVVYVSDVKTAEDKVRIIASAPENSHEPILYPIAAVKDSKNQDAARKFIELVLSAEGQQILQKYGFTSVK
jgi:molybdate transport system substrate-binding protein